MPASVSLRIEFYDGQLLNAAFDIDTLHGCRTQSVGLETSRLYPKDLDLLNDIVKVMRLRKDVYPAVKSDAVDAVNESDAKEGGE